MISSYLLPGNRSIMSIVVTCVHVNSLNPVFMLGQDSEELTQSISTPKLSKPGKQGKHNYRERIKFDVGIHYSLIGRVLT